jgi:hypothetical protein
MKESTGDELQNKVDPRLAYNTTSGWVKNTYLQQTEGYSRFDHDDQNSLDECDLRPACLPKERSMTPASQHSKGKFVKRAPRETHQSLLKMIYVAHALVAHER